VIHMDKNTVPPRPDVSGEYHMMTEEVWQGFTQARFKITRLMIRSDL